MMKTHRHPRWSLLLLCFLCLMILVGCGGPSEETPVGSDVQEETATPPTVPEKNPDDAGTGTPTVEEPREESTIYTATVGGSYGLIDVILADPETISSAKITMFDQVSQEAYYEDQFGAGIPQEDIKAGHYSTTYHNYVPDFEAYWAANGEGAFPRFEFTLTIERTDGETESYVAEHMGDGPNSVSVQYDPDAGAVKVRLYDSLGEDFIPVVCGAPEEAVGETVSVTVLVDGQPIPQENYTVADETEESQVSFADNPDERVIVTDYIRAITATLPQPISADAKASVVLDMELNGHRFTYTNPITEPLA